MFFNATVIARLLTGIKRLLKLDTNSYRAQNPQLLSIVFKETEIFCNNTQFEI